MSTQLIDVRTKEEYESAHVKSAVLLDFMGPNFVKEIAKLDKNTDYQLYCRSGNRSGQAMVIMKTLGFKKVVNLGSVEEAATALGLPIIR